jgi:hypothetical protein
MQQTSIFEELLCDLRQEIIIIVEIPTVHM